MINNSLDTAFAAQGQTPLLFRLQEEAQLVAKVCVWIDLHLDEDIGWDRLVRISGLSVPLLKAAFDRHLKITPMMYIRQRRTESR